MTKLRRIHTKLYYLDKNRPVDGPNRRMIGDASGISGDGSLIEWDCTGLTGDCSGIQGELDDCNISAEDRKNRINIEGLVLEE